MAVTIDGTTGITSPAIDLTTPLSEADGGTGLATGGFGFNQTWQAVTRTSGTTYTNSTGKPIVFETVQNISTAFTMTIGGVALYTFTTSASYGMKQSYIIPAGATYSFTCSSTVAGSTFELR